ncbi:MAG TPA: hypothetical protein VN110_10200, partial [Sphingobium sp.]|nr:hypothetical protein [Sphingobium sp.]
MAGRKPIRAEQSQATSPLRPTMLLRPSKVARLETLRASSRFRVGPQSARPALKNRPDATTVTPARTSMATDRHRSVHGQRQSIRCSAKMPRHVIAGA